MESMAVTVSLQLAPGPATSPVADARRPSVTLHHKSTGHQEAAATDQSRHIKTGTPFLAGVGHPAPAQGVQRDGVRTLDAGDT
jgi:hypothetical protein